MKAYSAIALSTLLIWFCGPSRAQADVGLWVASGCLGATVLCAAHYCRAWLSKQVDPEFLKTIPKLGHGGISRRQTSDVAPSGDRRLVLEYYPARGQAVVMLSPTDLQKAMLTWLSEYQAMHTGTRVFFTLQLATELNTVFGQIHVNGAVDESENQRAQDFVDIRLAEFLKNRAL